MRMVAPSGIRYRRLALFYYVIRGGHLQHTIAGKLGKRKF